ncbi:head-tail connector protein [Erwinia psidii]|uniref:Phage gp6-like head-tail connector protein n=1 Tax=Erwinia psidii TaxID=69224 RepID=A0A3N6S727_9GAMM|nr:head-tail connector protein [Erwinia psidii]RQM36880.1 phage gp6-like head-tail connector protein [Erwinia psidii]
MASELITLSEAKRHCRIDDDYDYEDALIQAYIEAALEVCQKHIGKRIPEEQEFTAALKVGCMMYASQLYEHRTTISEVEKSEVPMAISALWSVYRDVGVY